MKAFITLFSLTLSVAAHAGLPEDFAAMNQQNKGPFGKNMLQGKNGRTVVTNGSPAGGVLFQAAYRVGAAETLVRDYDFYTGNLFTTNYYQLMGEFVFGDANSNHPLDHAGLFAQASVAMPTAVKMVQHWLLEKQYMEIFHDAKLTKSFKLRGIGGSEFEQEYANYFFNFYLSGINGEFQYLPAFLLAKKSPIVESASLQKARDLCTQTYDYWSKSLGTKAAMTLAIYKIRNAVHNQLSKDVIRLIDKFDRDFPQYRRAGHTYLFEVRKILVSYYSFGADKLVAQAAKLGFGDVKVAADRIVKQGVTSANLLELSKVAADWRTNISDPAWLEDGKRARALALVADICQFLNRELAGLKNPDAAAVEAAVNVVYAEGFLIQDNWSFFAEEARASSDLGTLLTDVIEVASAGEGSTLYEAFSPAYEQWLSIDPKMEYFMDNTIKSSSLATAAAVAETLKR
jgi:hypothetical protein